MTISIDGKLYRGNLILRHGVDFPEQYRSITIEHSEYGECLIYITGVGTPYWEDPLTVKVPYTYYITEITEPSAEYVKKRRLQKSGLKLVEG